MTTQEFEQIKDKIKAAETNSAVAKGKLDVIRSQWQEKWNVSTLEEAEKKLAELKELSARQGKQKEELMDKLEKSFDWSSIPA